MLHKLKVGSLDKGMKSANELCISEINQAIQRKAKEQNMKSELATYHSETLQFIKENVSAKRVQLQKQMKKGDE